MIETLVTQLRSRGVKVGMQDVVALARALASGLHESSLEEFYFVARAVLVHDESQLDDFDQVFAHIYRGVPLAARALLDDIHKWLENPHERPRLSDEELAQLQHYDLDELKRLLEERLKEQNERHDGGGYWIGTGGRSPFGTGGVHPTGVSLGANPNSTPGGRSAALMLADARRYRSYRNDLVLDVRSLEVALRKLKVLEKDSAARPELDLQGSIDATARNFGELELVFAKPRRPDTRVILMMDVGGSMDPYARLVSQLFSAAKRATHWRELRTYYFHNCVYGYVYKTDELREPVRVRDLLRECDARYKLILVGDASMAPYELLGDAWADKEEDRTSGLEWLAILRRHFTRSAWLNPESISAMIGTGSGYGTTIETIARVFPMFPLTLHGLEETMVWLRKRT